MEKKMQWCDVNVNPNKISLSISEHMCIYIHDSKMRRMSTFCEYIALWNKYVQVKIKSFLIVRCPAEEPQQIN